MSLSRITPQFWYEEEGQDRRLQPTGGHYICFVVGVGASFLPSQLYTLRHSYCKYHQPSPWGSIFGCRSHGWLSGSGPLLMIVGVWGPSEEVPVSLFCMWDNLEECSTLSPRVLGGIIRLQLPTAVISSLKHPYWLPSLSCLTSLLPYKCFLRSPSKPTTCTYILIL